MKIAFVDLMFNWPPEGGARVDTKEVGERLARNHDLRLFAPDLHLTFPRGRMLEPVGFPVETIPFDGLSFNAVTLPQRFREVIGKFDPDVVCILDGYHLKPHLFHGLSDYPRLIRFYAYESLCLRGHGFFFRRGHPCTRDYLDEKASTWAMCVYCALSGNRRAPLFMHEFLLAGAFARSYPRTVARMLTDAAGIICYNSFIGARAGAHNRNVHIVPSGVDAARFPGKWKPASGKVTVSMVGRTGDPLKGWRVLERAGELLWEAQRRDFEVLLTLERGQEAEFSRPWIRAVPWRKPADLPSLYEEVDICVVPSLWEEPFGIVALEGMAAARPVVVSRVGGLQHIIDDGVSGYVVDRDSPEALAEKLDLLIADAGLRKRMGEAGRCTVLEKYQWDHIVERQIEPIFVKAARR